MLTSPQDKRARTNSLAGMDMLILAHVTRTGDNSLTGRPNPDAQTQPASHRQADHNIPITLVRTTAEMRTHRMTPPLASALIRPAMSSFAWKGTTLPKVASIGFSGRQPMTQTIYSPASLHSPRELCERVLGICDRQTRAAVAWDRRLRVVIS